MPEVSQNSQSPENNVPIPPKQEMRKQAEAIDLFENIKVRSAGNRMERALAQGKSASEVRQTLEHGGYDKSTWLDRYRATVYLQGIKGNNQFDPTSEKAALQAYRLLLDAKAKGANNRDLRDGVAATEQALLQMTGKAQLEQGVLREIYTAKLPTGEAALPELTDIASTLEDLTGKKITLTNYAEFKKQLPVMIREKGGTAHLTRDLLVFYEDALKRRYNLDPAIKAEDLPSAIEANNAARRAARQGKKESTSMQQNSSEEKKPEESVVQENERRIHLTKELFSAENRGQLLQQLPTMISIDSALLQNLGSESGIQDFIKQYESIKSPNVAGGEVTLSYLSKGSRNAIFETIMRSTNGQEVPVVIKIARPDRVNWGQPDESSETAQLNADNTNRLHQMLEESPLEPYLSPQFSFPVEIADGKYTMLTIQPKLEGIQDAQRGSNQQDQVIKTCDTMVEQWKNYITQRKEDFAPLIESSNNPNFGTVYKRNGEVRSASITSDIMPYNFIYNFNAYGDLVGMRAIDY